jgi:peptidyl-prolyl cis-trans isomerase C
MASARQARSCRATRYASPSAATAALQKGAFSQVPVKSCFGYHIIKSEDSRDTKKPEFNQVKEQLKTHLQQQQIETMITEMRAKAKIEEK